jgi:CBS domain-containing protein
MAGHGIVSERDVVWAVAANGDPDRVRVGDVMSIDPRYLTCGEPIASAVDAMLSAGVRHLPVLDEGEPVGIVSIRDVVGVSGTGSDN